jgi:SAM-dependent methyltransferase
VLDFGCGSGAWLNELQDRGWVTYGIEPSTDLAFDRHARLLSIPTQAQFQFVIAYHVLEHLPRPLDTLHHLAQALCSGGHCFISVPRLDGLAAHGKMHYCLQKHNHIVAFTEACMRGLLARAGLETLTSLHCLDRPDVPPHRLRLLARKGPVSHPLPDARLALQQVTREIDLLLKAGGGQ